MTPAARIATLLDQLREIEERLIPTGLHVLDEPGDLGDAVAMAAEHHPPAAVAHLEAALQCPAEAEAIVRVLSGRYIEPSSGGDIIRNPAAVPTGRNLHGLNPALVPNAYALRQARRTVELLLERALADGGAYPKSIGLVLWGTDNLKTDGEAIGQVLELLGVEPLVDDLGRVHDVPLRPLDELRSEERRVGKEGRSRWWPYH